MIAASALAIRRLPLQLPSASKIPARKPRYQSSLGDRGHSISPRTLATPSRE